MTEEWRPIVGFEGLYEISNEGNVRSLNYMGSKGKIGNISLEFNSKGYLLAPLHLDNIRKRRRVHRLVAEAFIPNPKKLSQVNHIDEDKSNNHVSNLEWCSPKYNTNHGTRNKRAGEGISKALSKPVVAVHPVNNKVVASFISTVEAGKSGYDPSSVSRCCRGFAKTHRGLHWQYV